MDDASSRPFLPQGALPDLFAGPQQLSHDERRAIADAVLSWLKAEHGEDLVAVALYGSTASKTDHAFSDVDMWAVLEDRAGSRPDLEWIWGPGKLEVERMTVTQAITRAAEVNASWPIAQSRFVMAQAMWEAPRQTGFVDRLRASAADLPEAARREAVAECVLQMYEALGKLRTCRAGPMGDVTRICFDFGDPLMRLVALRHRYVFATSRRLLAEALRLEGPAGFRPFLERLVNGPFRPPEQMVDLADECWASLPAWLEKVGLDVSLCLQPSPDTSGIAPPAEPPADRIQVGEGPPPLRRPARQAPRRRRVFGR
ncbi:kanamycin nucleotidyltransferase C-terminal domain-containing protein [Phenylobacterium sp.]|jgi:kanamycin nucleotidyltransferase|uniref:kanamycin nucleotidyltransferase C-terminal domain-containing protein n=1 Tax=Phenylobacterium sp. TaxID=1871053 RepID=UPI002E32EB5C|nr:kanamycin nucleotidyltransferase C-terminal domain-containing protein [Phenylobacterium sp.]HEX2560005.1 kanamycin nucleotidyltransferase C-terminal domain-containing protein [Phenylobacterium sp.]